MLMACSPKIELYVASLTNWSPGAASSLRMTRASTPPTRKKKKLVTTYMIPIFLWSTVVIQS